MKTENRRQNLRDALIAPAERATPANGLAGVKARDNMGRAVTHEKEWPLVAATLQTWLNGLRP